MEQPREAAAAALPAIDPVAVDASARRQYSFSRLSGRLHRRYEPADDDGAEEMGIDPLGLGTLVHAVLAAIDFARPDAWRDLVRLHSQRHLFAAESAEVEEAVRLIGRFLESRRAGDLAVAGQSLAEAEFLLGWPLEGTDDAPLLLSGYIDRLYQDVEGRWHVLDFKTNRVTAANTAQAAAGYEMQMLVYGLATEQILGAPPASLVLHFLQTGEEHHFTWDDAARRRAIALVDAGIAAARAAPVPVG